MKKIVLASRNKHKIEEFSAMLEGYEILSLDDIGFVGDVEETGTTFEENAKCKVDAVYDFCKNKNLNVAVLADDSGTCVNALGGAPGIYSARYAGDHNEEANRQKLLSELKDKADRSAYFECMLCYKDNGKTTFIEGRTYGKITTEKIGSDKFGYDCLFLSDDLGITFGQASAEQKNSVSHRSRAIQKFKEFLKNEK